MMNKKAMLLSAGLLCLHSVHAMEDKKELALGDSTGAIQQGFGQQQGMFAFVFTNMSSLASSGATALSAGFNSAVTTVNNKMSDVAALGKLGYPPTEPVNQSELVKFIAVRDRHVNDISALTINKNREVVCIEQFLSDSAYMNRRREYVQRGVMYALRDHAEGTTILQFIQENYESLIDPLLFSLINKALELHKEYSEKEAQRIAGTLLLGQGSAMLNSVLKNSGVASSGAEVKDQNVHVQDQEIKEEEK